MDELRCREENTKGVRCRKQGEFMTVLNKEMEKGRSKCNGVRKGMRSG